MAFQPAEGQVSRPRHGVSEPDARAVREERDDSFSKQARTNPIIHYSLKFSLYAALAIISPEPDTSKARVLAIGGEVFREGLRYATSGISLELLAHIEKQRLNSTLHRTRQYRDFLKQAVQDLVSLSEERIRQGETNVKSYIFLSMILAQAEAVEAGVKVELQAARPAKGSLELCDGLLKGIEGARAMPSPENAGLTTSAMEGFQGLGFKCFGYNFELESFFWEADFGHTCPLMLETSKVDLVRWPGCLSLVQRA